jgi:hypothetical protein
MGALLGVFSAAECLTLNVVFVVCAEPLTPIAKTLPAKSKIAIDRKNLIVKNSELGLLELSNF